MPGYMTCTACRYFQPDTTVCTLCGATAPWVPATDAELLTAVYLALQDDTSGWQIWTPEMAL